MHGSKLIFIEGIPGSGKSTMAQFISRELKRREVLHKWWYEEEKGHPVYIYDDYTSMGSIIQQLDDGNYKGIIQQAIAQWVAFCRSVQASDEIVIVDGCLFGYLTWTLFPYNVPRNEILAYIEEVVQLISACNPNLIYLYQRDVGAALQKICARRGGGTKERFIRSAIESPYGQVNSLSGFEGLVAFWEEYRKITDDAFGHFPGRKLALDNTDGDWLKYNGEIQQFLNLSTTSCQGENSRSLADFSGKYIGENEKVCIVISEDGKLLADGLPHAWPRVLLLHTSGLTFDVESLPLQITFETDLQDGQVNGFSVQGPELLDGLVEDVFKRVS